MKKTIAFFELLLIVVISGDSVILSIVEVGRTGVPISDIYSLQQGCVLCMQPPPENASDRFTLLLINSGQAIHVDVTQTDFSGNIVWGQAGNEALGCVLSSYCIGWTKGTFEADVTAGSHHFLDQQILETRYCDTCQAAILSENPQYDLVLLDHEDRRLYHLLENPGQFSIRDYTVTVGSGPGKWKLTIRPVNLPNFLLPDCSIYLPSRLDMPPSLW